jgi:hypothetical protein
MYFNPSRWRPATGYSPGFHHTHVHYHIIETVTVTYTLDVEITT